VLPVFHNLRGSSMDYRPVSLVVRRVAVLAGLLALSPCGFGSAQVASTTADIAAYERMWRH
jgi:hypothetical protein